MSTYKVLCHNSIKIKGNKIIYIDPYEVSENYNDADYIFCTHSHYDHFSEEDIKKVMKENTKIITVKSSEKEAKKIVGEKNILIVDPDREYKIDDINFKTTYAYNKTKAFHPKENMWVGFIIDFESTKYYIAGDTDNIEEIQNIECDVAFIPIGGKFTMDYKEAAELANTIKAKTVVPTHYGLIIGNKEDGFEFEKLVKDKKVEIFIK